MASISPPPDEVLIRYLLGELPPAETEQHDEQSVADPAFSDRLEAVENDLVDSYVRGELPDDLQERFRARYLTSDVRAQKVRFAAALARRQQRPSNVVPMKRRGGRVAPWLLPLAATIAVVALGLWFLPDNPAPAVSPTTEEAAASATPVPQPPPVAEDPAIQPPARNETLFAFTLAAPRRGVADVPAITIPEGATDVTLRMELEIDDFPRYRAILKDPSSDRTIWRSGALTAEAQGAGKVVPALIPARHFDTRRYWLELEGVPPGGAAEQIATYVFHVDRKPAR